MEEERKEGKKERKGKKGHFLENFEVELSCLLGALEDFSMILIKHKILSRLFPSGFARINHRQNVPLDN